MKRIYITYDNLKKQDGIGAQLQRIFGLYSIAKKFHLGYLHTPILNTLEELAHNVTSEKELKELLEDVNSKYNFPSDVDIEFDEEIYVHNVTIKIIAMTYIKNLLRRKRVLLKVCLPFGIMDKHPDWYEYSGEYLRPKFLKNKTNSEKIFVVHVRYGYKPIIGKNETSAPRFLPLSYYAAAVKNILETEKLNSTTKIVVHTDIPSKSGVWKPFQESKLSELSAIGYEIQKNALNFEGLD